MTELKLLPEQKTSEELLEKLVDSLPTGFPKDEEKNNYAVYGAIANYQSRTIDDIHEVSQATEVANAETFDQLIELSKFVDVYPRSGEGLEKFRLRVLSTFQNITSEGTPKDILDNASYILGISPVNINYLETETPGLITLGFPSSAVNNSALTVDQILSLLDQNVAAGYSLQSLITGTLSYIDAEDYSQGNHAPGTGYSGLDANGNNTNTGGTYSTTLE